MESQANNLLLTGPPSCGKTTAVLRLVERLADLRLAGLYTQEIRENGSRVGFEAVGISTRKHALLAHVSSRSQHRVGRYGVEPAALAPLVATELAGAAGEIELFVVDEIGKMELLCPEFVDAVRRLLDGPVPLLATVALKGGGLIAAVKGRDDVRLIEVAAANRDGLPAELEMWARGPARGRLGAASTGPVVENRGSNGPRAGDRR
jgi:nucleoside-triphosphatase